MQLVSVVLPIRNESAYIARTLASIHRQDYPANEIELIVIDGNSTDDTCQIVEEWRSKFASFTLLNNPQQIVPVSLNMALRRVHGDVIIWIDGHCEIAEDYVSRCVHHLAESESECVGGPIETIGTTYFAKAIAAAMSCFFGVGGSAFRTVKNRTMYVDTVAFPAYTRQALSRTGYFDEELVRNQDEEFNYRLRKNGGRVLLAADIHSVYYGRSSIRSLWRQYFQYGYWKVRVLQKHTRQMQIRHFVPPFFVGALIVLAALSPINRAAAYICVITLGFYGVANLLASISRAIAVGWKYLPVMPLVFAVLHFGYGLGFLVGLVAFRRRWGDRGLLPLEEGSAR